VVYGRAANPDYTYHARTDARFGQLAVIHMRFNWGFTLTTGRAVGGPRRAAAVRSGWPESVKRYRVRRTRYRSQRRTEGLPCSGTNGSVAVGWDRHVQPIDQRSGRTAVGRPATRSGGGVDTDDYCKGPGTGPVPRVYPPKATPTAVPSYIRYR